MRKGVEMMPEEVEGKVKKKSRRGNWEGPHNAVSMKMPGEYSE